MARNAAGTSSSRNSTRSSRWAGVDAGDLGRVDEHSRARVAVDRDVGDAPSGHRDSHPARRSGPVGKPELPGHQADAPAVALEARGPERGTDLAVPGELQLRLDRVRRDGGSRSELQRTSEHSGGHRPIARLRTRRESGSRARRDRPRAQPPPRPPAAISIRRKRPGRLDRPRFRARDRCRPPLDVPEEPRAIAPGPGSRSGKAYETTVQSSTVILDSIHILL